MIIKPTLFACPQNTDNVFEVFCCLRNQIRNDISCEQSFGRWFICNIKFYYLPNIHECTVQFVLINILRVKIKVTLCMLDKFSYFCHLYHVQFNINTILGTSPVRPFGHVWSGFKLLETRNLFVAFSGQTDLLKLYARVFSSSRQS